MIKTLQPSFLIFLLAAVLAGCGDDDNGALFNLSVQAGSQYDATAYTPVAANASLAGLWLMVGQYDYQNDDPPASGQGRELFRASLRVNTLPSGFPGGANELSFEDCYSGASGQTASVQNGTPFELQIQGGVLQLTADGNMMSGRFIRDLSSGQF
ncbi:MAG: hypothetical protein ACR2PS_15805, partial [Pseudomonadales bacterium]